MLFWEGAFSYFNFEFRVARPLNARALALLTQAYAGNRWPDGSCSKKRRLATPVYPRRQAPAVTPGSCGFVTCLDRESFDFLAVLHIFPWHWRAVRN